jgi:TonB-linked SusC/RagA family outer membrane protein
MRNFFENSKFIHLPRQVQKKMNSTLVVFILLFLFQLCSLSTFAQSSVHGVVKNSNGEFLQGVTVKLKNSSLATSTDAQGKYSINLPNLQGALEFSFTGYKTKGVAIASRILIDVLLEADISKLDEVVVVGYISTAKKDITGSVGIVNVNDLQKAPVQSFEEALAGRVAGVQVASQDGKPGSTVNILIRGIGSISQSSAPLYVIDGMAIENPDNNLLDPANIESFTVLKDASATAIYGARGGNGVIVITTKKGKVGPSAVNYNGYSGINQPYKYYKLLSPYEFVRLASDQFGAANNAYLNGGRTLEDYRNVKGIDFQDLLLRTGTTANHSISISGGNSGTTYSLSGNYVKQTGIIIASDYERYQGKISLDQKVGTRGKVGGFLQYTRNKLTGANPSPGATSSLFFSAFSYRPIPVPAFEQINYEDLLYDPANVYPTDFRLNPIISYVNEMRNNINRNIVGSVYINYNILKNLKLTLRGSVNSNDNRIEVFNNSKTRSGGIYSSLGINGSITNINTDVFDNTNLLEYNTTIGKKHRITVLLGTGLQKTNYKTLGYSANNIPDETLGLSGIDVGIIQQASAVSRLSTNSLVSGFGNLNYTYANKYYLTANIRADGSSKFLNNKWGYFPSAAIKWKISEEKFFKKQSTISDANIRVSYGEAGNNRVGDFDYASNLNFTSTLYLNGTIVGLNAVTSTLANPGLKWETSIEKNMALDLGFFKNRINLTVEYYDKKIKDLLYRANIPGNTGYTTAIKNIASLTNRGIEITLEADIVKKKNFTYSSSFNISFNRNRLDALADPTEEGILSAPNWDANFTNIPAFISRIGGPLGQIYGLVFDGLYQYSDFDKLPNNTYLLKGNITANSIAANRASVQPGQMKFVDLNGDGQITADDRTVIGNGYPIHTGGWSNNFRYKNFDANLFFQWSYGNDIINANRIWFEGGEITNRAAFGPQNAFAAYANRWTPTNQNTDIAKVGSNSPVYSTQYVEDGSYIRLKTLNVGYTLPQKIVSRYKIKKLRVYIATSNLYTLTRYKGYDPEVSTYSTGLSPALDYSSYPRPITITGGINLTL